MSPRPFRFRVTLPQPSDGIGFLDRVAAVDAAGADALLLPDHLGMLAPTAALIAAAAHAPRLRVGTFVLNSGFYSPALLTRDLATVDRLTGGRLEIGLGAGFSGAEYAAAGLDFPPAGRRVDHLIALARHVRTALSSGDHSPAPIQTPPPITIGGSGDRVLAFAAREADVVALSLIPDRERLADRVALIRDTAVDRVEQPIIDLSLFDLGLDRAADIEAVRFSRPDASDAELRRSVNVVGGSMDEVVGHLLDLRAELGITSVTLSQPSESMLADAARVIRRIREIDASS